MEYYHWRKVLQNVDVKDPDGRGGLLEFLAWCAVERSKVVDKLSDHIFNCFCVRAAWRQLWKFAKSEEDFWTGVACQFESRPLELWPTLRALAPLVPSDSACLVNLVQTCLKNSLAQPGVNILPIHSIRAGRNIQKVA